jgi:hypothetical protein
MKASATPLQQKREQRFFGMSLPLLGEHLIVLTKVDGLAWPGINQ